MKLYIKNITCKCCELFVRRMMEKFGLQIAIFKQCEIMLATPATPEVIAKLDAELSLAGLSLLHDEHAILIERIKSEIRSLVNEPAAGNFNLSTYLSSRLRYNYAYLSHFFSQSEGMTIRDFVIEQRISQIKRLLVQEELDLVAISTRLHYSSTAHLAAQFKKITGQTTSEFKREWMAAPAQARVAYH